MRWPHPLLPANQRGPAQPDSHLPAHSQVHDGDLPPVLPLRASLPGTSEQPDPAPWGQPCQPPSQRPRANLQGAEPLVYWLRCLLVGDSLLRSPRSLCTSLTVLLRPPRQSPGTGQRPRLCPPRVPSHPPRTAPRNRLKQETAQSSLSDGHCKDFKIVFT
uniref:Uncharacterized protein n=1 Tax=Pipistrellus kuhlii TaxID=59472 RepID=A0A7J7RCV2_PIPKU|nr:hypothetical protein mPipKuh1_010695 [Pipistrellus kuhlii]